MRNLLLLLISLLSVFAVQAKTPSDIPLEAFFKDAQFNNMQISPDGKHLAVIYDTGNSNTLAIMDIGLTELKAKINFGEYRIMITQRGLDLSGNVLLTKLNLKFHPKFASMQNT